jgi:2-oxoglutarate ferredoxin oxidoreductase subunit gamma
LTHYEIRLAGTGGQGLILGGIILAEAASIYEGLNVVQTQSYGPEARGGASRAEVIITTGQIFYPKVTKPNVLMALAQEACDKYSVDLQDDSMLIVDADLVETINRPVAATYRVPITRAARESTGKEITANIVGLGVLVGLSGVVSREAIEKAVLARVPAGMEELNRRALQAGFDLAQDALNHQIVS